MDEMVDDIAEMLKAFLKRSNDPEVVKAWKYAFDGFLRLRNVEWTFSSKDARPTQPKHN